MTLRFHAVRGSEAFPPDRLGPGGRWFNDRWDYETLTPASAEGMHIDDEPTVYRAGKAAAGRLLDGVLHDAFPASRPPGRTRGAA